MLLWGFELEVWVLVVMKKCEMMIKLDHESLESLQVLFSMSLNATQAWYLISQVSTHTCWEEHPLSFPNLQTLKQKEKKSHHQLFYIKMIINLLFPYPISGTIFYSLHRYSTKSLHHVQLSTLNYSLISPRRHTLLYQTSLSYKFHSIPHSINFFTILP